MDPARRPVNPSRGMTCGAILLAGGRATRVGGAQKTLFEVGGETLLARAVRAVRDAGADPVVVAAPVLDDALDVAWVREEPAYGGPAAAIVAALDRSQLWRPEPEWVLVLACDLPRVDAAVALLRDAVALVPADTDGVCLGDASSRPQWLTGVYRTRALRAASRALPDRGRDAAVRALIDDLAVAVLAAPDDVTSDVDTWEDLERARAAVADRPSPHPDAVEES
jgi:molybdopterin-guanine dinucleotide biosynthesis protein A